MNPPTHRTPAEKLQRLVLADVEFHSTPLRDAIEYLRQEGRRLDMDEADPVRKGVAIWIDPGIYEQFFMVAPNAKARRITGKFTGTTLGDTLRCVVESVGLEVVVTDCGAFLCLPLPQVPVVVQVQAVDRMVLDRHINAAEGYSELGMPQEVDAELEPIARAVDDCLEAGDWQGLERAAEALAIFCPTQVDWPLRRAHAIRQTRGMEEGAVALRTALILLPDAPMLHFHLACYEARLGGLDAARGHLAEAIRLQPACREQALRASDLAALHGELI